MDPRRLLILASLGLALGGCAAFSRTPAHTPGGAALAAPTGWATDATPTLGPPAQLAKDHNAATDLATGGPAMSGQPPRAAAATDPTPSSPTERAYLDEVAAEARGASALVRGVPRDPPPADRPGPPGRNAAAASLSPDAATPAPGLEETQARALPGSDRVVGGVQIFARAPGRVYEVRTAPLRVTTLTLGPGETVVATAAGDTVRWQIGETRSGEGRDRRAHVLIKPFEGGLQTNLVVTTSHGLYLVDLRSGTPETFHPAVTWDMAALTSAAPGTDEAAPAGPPALVEPVGPLDGHYRVTPRGRRPAWTPSSVRTDGVRTFLEFPPALAVGEAPVLFDLGPGGELRTLNYRQSGDLWVVDQVLDRAELRLGDRRPQIVRIQRLPPSHRSSP